MSDPTLPPPIVLAFDVFGTVVDWHGSIAREVEAMRLGVDASRFALAWRAGYQPAMARVRSGELGWTRIEVDIDHDAPPRVGGACVAVGRGFLSLPG